MSTQVSPYTATLSSGETVGLSVPPITHSLMLSNTLSFEEVEGPVPLELSSHDWKLYSDFVAEVSRLEKTNKLKFVPNAEFAVQFFQTYSPQEIKDFGRIHRYLASQILEESLKWFYGAFYAQFTLKDIVTAYGASKEQVENSQKEAKRVLEKEIVKKACTIVPELTRWNIKLTEH